MKTIIIICTMILVAAILGINNQLFVSAQSAIDIQYEYTLEDNFSDNGIIVTLYERNSRFRGISKKLSDKIFNCVAVKNITDLTALSEDYVNFDGSVNANVIPELALHYSKITFNQILHIELEENGKQNVLNSIEHIQKIDEVKYATPDMIGIGASVMPNDSYIDEQWALIGENGINAKEAWSITTGSRDVRVGVIDSGLNSHIDINDNVDFTAGRDFFYEGCYGKSIKNPAIRSNSTRNAG